MPSNHLILCCPLLLLPQSFLALWSFQMSQLFTSGGQSIRVSTSTSVLSMNTQDWSPLLFFFFFSFIFISWKLITLQYCSGFCHTLTWISHGFTCIPHPDPPSHLPLYPIPLISFRMDWLDLLAVQGTLRSLLQHHNSKASILRCSVSLELNSHICTWLLEKP